MNILYLMTTDLNVGGAQQDIVTFVKEYTQKGHRIVVVCRNGNLEKDLAKFDAKYYNRDFHFRSPIALYNGMKLLKSIIKKENIDIIAPQSIRTSIAASFSNIKTRKPIITTIHSIQSWSYSIVAGLILNMTSRFVIFESEYERRRLIRVGLNRRKTVVVHSGIDLEKFAPRPKDENLLKEIGCCPDDVMIGTVARLSPEKGQTYLIEAMKDVIEKFPKAKLIFVGDGLLRETLKEQVRCLGLEKNIKFLGEQRDVPRYLSLMDVFVLSSVRESFPLAAREAMTMGKPVVATRIGGCDSVVDDDTTGILVPPANITMLAAAIMQLLNDEPQMLEMGELGRMRALDLFSREKWLDTNERLMLHFTRKDTLRLPNVRLRNMVSNVFYCFIKLLKRKHGIRVLMYHRINDTRPDDRLCVKATEFRQQMEFLYKHNYTVITLEEAVRELLAENQNDNRVRASSSLYRKENNKPKVVLTFDDGFKDNYTNAYPVLKGYDFPATVFLAVDAISDKEFLNWDEIKEMAQNNISFGAHTLKHVELAKVSLEEAEKEINGSKETIRAKGLKCDYFCYPNGDFNREIKDLVRKAGFSAACSIKPGANLPKQDLFELRRTEISAFDNLFDFRKKLAGAFDLLHSLAQRRQAKLLTVDKKLTNILYVIWSLGLGGAEQVVISLAKGLDKRKFHPIVCCLNEKGVFASELEKEGIQVLALHKRGKFDITMIKKLVHVIKQYRIDIVHTHLWGANLWGRLAAILCRIPVITTEHNEDIWKPRSFLYTDKILSLFTDKIIAVSNKVKEFYTQRAKIRPSKIEIVYNGVESNRFDEIRNTSFKKKELGIEDGELVLGMIGRLVPQKGHIYFLDALNALSKDHNIRGLIVGTGPLDEQLKGAAERKGLNGKVIFTGLRQDMPELFGMIDILVMPSLREGMPMVALEAMAAGVPIVATDVGGNPEVIVNGETGILVPPRDAKALKNALEKLITDRNYSEALSKKSKFRIRESFDVTTMVSNTEKIYENRLCS